jgi:hypothetical protein
LPMVTNRFAILLILGTKSLSLTRLRRFSHLVCYGGYEKLVFMPKLHGHHVFLESSRPGFAWAAFAQT